MNSHLFLFIIAVVFVLLMAVTPADGAEYDAGMAAMNVTSDHETGSGPIHGLDCPFFMQWSVDWQVCTIPWHTFYGLYIVLVILVIIVSAILVAVWKIYKRSSSRQQAD